MIYRTLATGALLSAYLIAATDLFVGKWKYNDKKSEIPSFNFVIKDVGSNRYLLDYGGTFTETLTPNGSFTPSSLGGTRSLQKLDESTWQITDRRKTDAVTRYHLSPDGKSMQADSTVDQANGDKRTSTRTYQRVGPPTKDWAGTWKPTSQEVKATGIADILEISPYGSGGLSFLDPSDKGRLDMNFDGKEYRSAGPNAGQTTTSGKRVDARTIHRVSRLDGRIMGQEEDTVSPDGKTLTVTFTSGNAHGKTVFDRQ
jgi:hypothetical protein